MDTIGGMGTVGDWREFPYDEVKQHVLQLAGNPDFSAATVAADKADGAFNHGKGEITSILQPELASGTDSFIKRLSEQRQQLSEFSPSDVAKRMHNGGQVLTRDTV